MEGWRSFRGGSAYCVWVSSYFVYCNVCSHGIISQFGGHISCKKWKSNDHHCVYLQMRDAIGRYSQSVGSLSLLWCWHSGTMCSWAVMYWIPFYISGLTVNVLHQSLLSFRSPPINIYTQHFQVHLFPFRRNTTFDKKFRQTGNRRNVIRRTGMTANTSKVGWLAPEYCIDIWILITASACSLFFKEVLTVQNCYWAVGPKTCPLYIIRGFLHFRDLDCTQTYAHTFMTKQSIHNTGFQGCP